MAERSESHEPVFDQVFEAFVDPILSIDEAGIVLSANPAVTEAFGWERDEIVGENVRVLMGEPYRTEHDDYIRRFLETGERRAIGRVRMVTGRHRSGREFPCELSVSLVKRESGRFRFFGIVRDVSAREEMAARLAQVERLAAIGELAAGVAHEVNNPVNTIINCAQLLKDGDEDVVLIDDIISEGMRIAMIVRDLLDFARDGRTEMAPVSVEELVRRTLSLVGRRIKKQGIAIEVDVADGLPELSGRAHQLQQVLLNLLLNARDALLAREGDGPDREIRFSVRCLGLDDDRRVEIRVRDNGVGISPAYLDRIFNPFFSTKRGSGGSGLGLAVSKGIVEDHGGSIAAHSIPGRYAEFVIVLPVEQRQREA